MHPYDFKDKKIALLGFGRSNREALGYLYKYTQDVSVFDEKNKDGSIDTGSRFKNVVTYTGENCFEKMTGFDYIFRSPAIRPDNEYILREIERGAVLTSEVEVFISLCRGKVIGVTGSDGKTTTSSLIYDIVRSAGHKAFLGGNIGTPLIGSLDMIGPDAYVILELSSFQLMTFKERLDIAVITNISPNHLDYHKSYKEYIDSKKNIALHSGKDSLLILNGNDEDSVRYFGDIPCRIEYFNSDKGIYFQDGNIHIKDKGMISTSGFHLLGIHNIENLMAAIAVTKDIADIDSIKKAVNGFRAVEHRAEYVETINGVIYINDSIASSPKRTVSGLKSFDRKVILIAGGKDKGIPYDGIGKDIAAHVKYLILLGQTKDVILQSALAADRHICYSVVCSLEEAVKKAYDVSSKGDIVFFSPASTSFDMFSNFEERGNKFKEYVKKLKELS